jgi:hypothetical protein
MAISPNTTFGTGAVLTSDQANRFPRGVMAFNTVTTSDNTITSEEVQITGSSFTAVANRYYKITYYEPAIYNASTATATARIRLTNLAGAVQQSSLSFAFSTWEETTCVAITTLTAGTTNFVATLQCTSSSQASRTSTQYAFLLVEDIGPA